MAFRMRPATGLVFRVAPPAPVLALAILKSQLKVYSSALERGQRFCAAVGGVREIFDSVLDLIAVWRCGS